ncbi:MAG: bifunctional 4-hydroxy-2-oxoglutarate aldolase/2-dehydro-3-deoxy-phosphogluconate aldolase [Gammaproteobacteria bacterium]|nr:bifunctional 4-hydroxy-2-oxoglutarate aldolase/2-dehydro-3-deoxy-phosphogluconate aldolase [Gammaproteobacteria bacterium]
MSSTNWKMTSSELFAAGPVVPVIVITEIEQALPLAKALLDGGIKVMEVTLRTDCGVDAIKLIADNYPEAIIGAGTVINTEQLAQVAAAGAKFAISPGSSTGLLTAAIAGNIPLIPGVTSPSELMTGIELGYDHFKFFPAEANGGVKALKALGAPFKGIKFCPTGGITLKNAPDYLALESVCCIGGSWIVPLDLVEAGEWQQITKLCTEAVTTL